MRFAINIPNFGDFADPRAVADLAQRAEAAGWDGLFVWDHVTHEKRLLREIGDPWVLLTAAALARQRGNDPRPAQWGTDGPGGGSRRADRR
jgi:hypothetical protein